MITSYRDQLARFVAKCEKTVGNETFVAEEMIETYDEDTDCDFEGI